jgi:nucleoside-diphosphate-sugar epimerase
MAKVLVLGGVGFIGRNLVTYLVQNNIAAYIRVVDKVLPATAFLGSPHREAFDNPAVDCKQCNLCADGTLLSAIRSEEQLEWCSRHRVFASIVTLIER